MLVLQDDTVKSGSEEAIAKRLKLNPLKIRFKNRNRIKNRESKHIIN